MRIVSWNIRAGGGRRCHDIAAQLAAWRPDVAVLSEFRATPPSRLIAASLAGAGLGFQRTTSDPAHPARNALIVASRWPLRRIRAANGPADRHRWLPVNVAAPRALAILAVHVPNRSSGHKYPFLDAVTQTLRHWRGVPALLLGDTNSGCIDADEESPAFNAVEDAWVRGLDGLGWRDAFRARHGARREFTWYSPNRNNGFRLDQAFMHPRLAARLRQVSHSWGAGSDARRDALSDHAALVLDLEA
jgi:exonuclease III